MIFYQSPASLSDGPSIASLRTATVIALAAYPAGAALLAAAGAQHGMNWTRIGGFSLIALSLVAATPVLGSRLQRIVGDQASRLDERETALRHQALGWAYSAFTAMALLAIFYAGVASDAGFWVPRGFDAWNGLFWGAFLYATLLPTAFLAWTSREPELEPEA